MTIWEGFKDWFAAQGFAFDFVLYSGYEAQAEAHLAGDVDVTWDSPLAWVRTRRLAAAQGREARAVAMRDTDQDLTSVVLVRDDSDISEVADLAGRTVATGAVDSPQATLLPLAHLAGLGLDPGTSFVVRRFDVMVAKHGDHVGGERDAVRAARRRRGRRRVRHRRQPARCSPRRGRSRPARCGSSPGPSPYDHCTMTVLDDVDDAVVDRFVELLLSMSFDDPAVRPLLELEGLTAWRPGRTEGYRQLEAAVDRLGFYGADGSILVDGYPA